MSDYDELRIDAPDDISDLDDPQAFIDQMAESHNALVSELERIDENINTVFTARLGSLGERLDAVEDDVNNIGGEVEVVSATMPDQQSGKVDRVKAILDYAFEYGSGGLAGVTVKTGEATAAAKSSRATALRLMDEIGANFQWADTENPGGPKPKRLKLSVKPDDRAQVMADIHAHYTSEGATG